MSRAGRTSYLRGKFHYTAGKIRVLRKRSGNAFYSLYQNFFTRYFQKIPYACVKVKWSGPGKIYFCLRWSRVCGNQRRYNVCAFRPYRKNDYSIGV